MSNRNRTTALKCGECGRPLRNQVFCQDCRQALCSWICYIRHLKLHERVQSNQPSSVDDAGGLAGMEGDLGRSSSGPGSALLA